MSRGQFFSYMCHNPFLTLWKINGEETWDRKHITIELQISSPVQIELDEM